MVTLIWLYFATFYLYISETDVGYLDHVGIVHTLLY